MVAIAILVLLAGNANEPSGSVTVTDPVVTTISAGTSPLPALEFRVTNGTAEPVTAWRVALECLLSDKATVTRAQVSDRYGSYAGIDPQTENSFIPALGSVTDVIVVDVPAGASVLAVRARIEWVIFADGSWIGNPADVQRIFQNRESDWRAMVFIVETLRAAQRSHSGRDALRVALLRVNDNRQEDFDHPQKRSPEREVN